MVVIDEIFIYIKSLRPRLKYGLCLAISRLFLILNIVATIVTDHLTDYLMPEGGLDENAKIIAHS